MTRGLVTVVLLAGCGRLAFDGTRDAGEQVADAPAEDVADAPADTVDGPPGFTCLPSYRTCDGFETPALQSFWTPLGSVSLDATVAHRGTQSVRFHSDAVPVGSDRYVLLSEISTLPAADPTLYVRAWVRLGMIPLNNMGLISAEQSGSAPEEVAVFVLPDSLGVFTQFSNQSQHNNTLPPTNTWFCVIWQLVRSTTTSGALYLTGDQPPAQLTGVMTDGNPTLRELAIGIALSGTTNTVLQPAFDIWFDDVIVSPAQISCSD